MARKNTNGKTRTGKVGRKTTGAKKGTTQARRARVQADQDCSELIGVAAIVLAEIKDEFDHFRRAGFCSMVFSSAVTGLMMQGQTDPDAIAVEADKIAEASWRLVRTAIEVTPPIDTEGDSGEPDTSINADISDRG